MSKAFLFLSALMCLVLYGCDSPDKQTSDRRYQHNDKQIDKRVVIKRCSDHLPKIKDEWRLMDNHIDEVGRNLPELNEKLNSIKRKAYNRYSTDSSNHCYAMAVRWFKLEKAWSEIVATIKNHNPDNKTHTGLILDLSYIFDIKEGPIVVAAVEIYNFLKRQFFNNSKSSLEYALTSFPKDEFIFEAERRALYAKYHKEKIIKFLESKP